MIDFTTMPLPFTLLLCFLGGLVLGYAYFRSLRATADLIVGGGHPMIAMALTLGRFAFLGIGFYLTVLAGGFALLAALVGVLSAKVMALRQTQGAHK